MDFRLLSFLKMVMCIVSLILLVQVPRLLLASGTHANICGEDQVAYAHSSTNELVDINGCLVDKKLFCKAIKLNGEKSLDVEEQLKSYHCDFNVLLGKLPLTVARKALQEVKDSEREKFGIPSNTKMALMAAPVFFVLCCGLYCPCFRPKRKDTGQPALAKEPSSMHSVSSFEGSSAPEKIPGSPVRVPPSPSRFSMSPKLTRLGSIHLNMNEVSRATQNFSPSLKIGEGGFGTVYRARLQGGQVVAIKRAKKELFESLRTEFSTEVELLAKIDHRNLVKLLGFVDKGNDRILITEYVPNGTLREHLDGQRGKILDFNQRLEITIDIAHALTYLHLYTEKQIIHRDVKSSNILLTESLRAKVADFGFARVGPMDSDKTHISTKVKGTVGYLDPEYMRTYQLTAKSDVYSFGVLLIEILSGRRPVELKKAPEERVTLRWAFNKYNEGSALEMLDPLMEEAVDTRILMKMFGLAMQCAAPRRSNRPDMKSVGEQLWAIRMDYLKRAKRP